MKYNKMMVCMKFKALEGKYVLYDIYREKLGKRFNIMLNG
jgi:hypothetical protein